MTIPPNLRPFFQEYELESLKPTRDANLIIQRTLEYGNWDDIRWTFRMYGSKRVRKFVRERGERMLSRVAFNYWRRLLHVQRWRHSPFAIPKGTLWER